MRKGRSTNSLAARFRLRCRSAAERAMVFGVDSFRVCSPRLPDCKTIDAALLQLLQSGVDRAEILHFRGHIHVATLYFCRDGWHE